VISVVTICLNAATGLERTLQSVARQEGVAREQVVIDGGSTDGTLAVIERYRAGIDYFVSEPDRGIPHAFNKGIAASTGDWILMLNAGDTLIGTAALRRLAEGTLGDARIVSARARCGARSLPRFRVSDRLGLLLKAHVAHQATLVHRDVYAEHGGYDESFPIRMDFEFFLRVLARERLVFLDEWLVEFEPGGRSSQFLPHWREGRRALAKNGCGLFLRVEYEAFFLLLAGERLLRAST
jgi:glycosyltransferase involved in cell wall biosynthesis